MKKLAIVGAGGHGKVVADAAQAAGWQKIEFFDDEWPEKQCNALWDVVGNLKDLKNRIAQYSGLIIAIGNNKTRLRIMTDLQSINPPWVNIIHPRSVISPYVELGLGIVVFAGVVVNPMTQIASGVILNTGATIDHDCNIEEAVHICPGCHVAGDVTIGQLSWLGIGSTVKQGVNIGKEVMIGAGSVVIKDIPNNQLAYGVPASIRGAWNAYTPFPPWPSYTLEEAEAIKQTLLSNQVNYWTGNQCRLFEKEFAHWVGTDYAIAVANGTLALDLIFNAMGIGTGDEVVVTSRTFIASVSSIINCGATPIFADIDRDSQNISPDTIKAVLTPKTKAILCVHLAGWPCEMDSIMTLAKQYNLLVIEDCAQAHGAQLNGKSVGSFGHASAWSFCQDKIMTTGGEGGMVTTNDKNLWSKMWAFKDHGKSWEAVYEKKHPPGFRWVHESFGSNFRMLEIQAVLGLIQLKKMPEWQKKRFENASTIWECAKKIKGLRVPEIPEYIPHAAYKCYVFVEVEKLKEGWSRDRIVWEINDNGVPCFMGSCSEVYLEKAFDDKTYKPEYSLSAAKELGETSLMFLVHPTLMIENLDKTCDVLNDIMKKAVV